MHMMMWKQYNSWSERLDLLNPVVIGTISSLVGKIPVMHYFSSYVVL